MLPACPARSEHGARFTLATDVCFLNHGSFGATPRVLLDAQTALRERAEANPMQFWLRDLEGLLDQSRASLARLVGAKERELAFVPNATAAVSTVLRSLRFCAGGELLTTDHAYNACKNALDFVAAETGARVVVAKIPFPIAREEDAITPVLDAVTARTRFVLLDHVSSPTGLVMPIEPLAKELGARGIDVFVDGAHAPGMIALDLGTLGVPFYTGNCHKWLCTPKSAAMFYVREDRQKEIRPLAISHGASSPRVDRSRFLVEHDWVGTTDPTAYLVVGDAISYLDGIFPGGLPELMRRNRALALAARTVLCEALGVEVPSPESMIGSLAAVPLPDGPGDAKSTATALFGEPLQESLRARHAIEVPIVPWPSSPKRLVRISAQIYNSIAEYTYLAEALQAELAAER
ncbi:aminotransferase class V-fold PLP-dependent enzyme [soil metagenome]